jgi:hypothetical protein
LLMVTFASVPSAAPGNGMTRFSWAADTPIILVKCNKGACDRCRARRGPSGAVCIRPCVGC